MSLIFQLCVAPSKKTRMWKLEESLDIKEKKAKESYYKKEGKQGHVHTFRYVCGDACV